MTEKICPFMAFGFSKLFRIILTSLSLCGIVNVVFSQSAESITVNISSSDLPKTQLKPHLLGVIAGPLANHNSTAPDLSAKFKYIGVTTVRNNDYYDDRLDMERMFFCGNYPINGSTPQYPKWDCDPTKAEFYHFAESDSLFQSWISGGFAPFLRLGGEFNHIIRKHDYKGPRSHEESNWIQAAIKVTERYNSFGGKSNTLGGYLNIWTEFPHRHFWDRDSVAFVNFWANSYDSLKRHFPSLKIGGPGFNTSVSQGLGKPTNGDSTNGFVNGNLRLFLSELKNKNLKPDWIGFHVFSNKVDDFYNAALYYKKLLRAEKPFTTFAGTWGSGDASFFKNTALVCDAWGFDNDQNLSASERDEIFNKQRGAAHHVGVFIAFQHADIERAYIYRGGEMNADTTLSVMGLFQGNAQGNYKPAAYGFKLCHKLLSEFPQKLNSPVFQTASGGSKIWTLAGSNGSEKAILIANPTASNITLSLKADGVSVNEVEHFTVSNSNNGTSSRTYNSSGSIILPPYTSHLIHIKSVPSATTEEDAQNGIKLYPNPSKQQLFFSETLESVKIYDAVGQLVLEEKNAVNSISVKDWKKGIYFLHIKNQVLKFIVE